MKLGIVGLPNVGKSTLFNAITNAGAESANYPFCTIDPNVGTVAVPDTRLDWLSDFYKPKKTTPAVVEFVDIAGLVKGIFRDLLCFCNYIINSAILFVNTFFIFYKIKSFFKYFFYIIKFK